MQLLAVLILAQAASAQPAKPHGVAGAWPANGSCRLRVLGSSEMDKRGTPHFSATEALDVEFEIRFYPRPGDRRVAAVALELFTPRGHLYQKLEPRLVGEAPPRGRRLHVAEVRLPVAGTAIAANSLYGQWRAAPLLDGRPCAAARSFVIEERLPSWQPPRRSSTPRRPER